MKTMTAKDKLDKFMDELSREELRTLILFTEYQALVTAEKFEREEQEHLDAINAAMEA